MELGLTQNNPTKTYARSRLALPSVKSDCCNMELAHRALLDRTAPARRVNGERQLAHNIFMQVTWSLLAAALLGQLFLLIWLDVMS